MKKREEISEKYKWDLTDYCKDNQDCISRLNIVKKEMQKIKDYETKLFNEETVFECLLFNSDIWLKLDALLSYATLKVSEDGENSEAKELQEKGMSVYLEFSTLSSFIKVEISELPTEVLNKLMLNSSYPQFREYFRDISRFKPHILSKKEEALLSKMQSFSGGFSEVFDMLNDVDFTFESVQDAQGNKKELTHGNYGLYIQSSDRVLRKNAMIGLHKKYQEFNNTLATNYINDIKANAFSSKIRNFDSCLENALFGEEISGKVYDNLIDSANKNLSVFHKYFEIKRQELKLDKFAIYDLSAPTTDRFNVNISYEEAIELVKKATAPLGVEYMNLVQKAYDERWIDVYENKGKTSGAFENASYRIHPVVLLNYKENINSVFTIAHELGHAMHSYYSDKKQPYETSHYSIFLAEIASNVNEILLLLYLMKTAKTKEEKIFCYSHFMYNFYGSFFRQAMFSEFESKLHSIYESTQILSKDILNNIYWDLNKKYFGGNVELLSEIRYEWSRIPHFYRAFYVYKYATGITSAVHIAKRLFNNEEGAKESYLQFLSAGSSRPPLEVLKLAGVNLEDPLSFQEVFEFAESILNDWKKI
ncbi:MAG: oligoendopeptidase F [Clostridia bacterium]|nr:oligoendopeptidase F [Clostridia bacterium]